MFAIAKNYIVFSIIALLSISIYSTNGRFYSNDSNNDTKDPSLDHFDLAKIDALSHYGWGYYLSDFTKTDWEKAHKHYLTAIKNDPYSDFLIKEILRFWSLYDSYNNTDQIIENLGKIAKDNPSAIKLNLTVANAYIAKEEFNSGQDLLVNVLRHVKWTEPLLIKALAQCHLGAGEIRKGDKLFRHATSERNLRGDYHVEKTAADFYNSIANKDDYRISERKRLEYQTLAYQHALTAASTFPHYENAEVNEETMALIAILLQGNFIEQVITILTAQENNQKRSIDAEILLAKCYEATEQFAKALTIWKELSNDFPFNPFYHVRMGHVLKISQRYNDALLAFKTAYQLVESPKLVFELATIYYLLDRPKDALEYALRSPPNNLNTVLLLSYIYRNLGQLEQSLEVLKSVQSDAKENDNPNFLTTEYYLALGTAYYMLDRKEETIQTLEKAVEQYPKNSEINNFLGYYLADENRDLRRAKRCVRNALKADPNNSAYLDSLAWVLYRQGHYREAAKNIENAIRLQQSEIDSVILDHAGDIYFSIGDLDKAIHFWNGAIAQGGRDTDRIKQKIQDLLNKQKQ